MPFKALCHFVKQYLYKILYVKTNGNVGSHWFLKALGPKIKSSNIVLHHLCTQSLIHMSSEHYRIYGKLDIHKMMKIVRLSRDFIICFPTNSNITRHYGTEKRNVRYTLIIASSDLMQGWLKNPISFKFIVSILLLFFVSKSNNR